MGKLYLFNACTFCKSIYVINEGSPYGLPCGTPYIFYIYMIKCVGWVNIQADFGCESHQG